MQQLRMTLAEIDFVKRKHSHQEILGSSSLFRGQKAVQKAKALVQYAHLCSLQTQIEDVEVP
jgi:hypothetical protein